MKSGQKTSVGEMIAALAASMMPFTSGIKLAPPGRKNRKRRLSRIQRANARKERTGPRKYMALREKDSRRGMDGTMR